MLNKIIYTILGISLTLVFYPRTASDPVKQPIVAGISSSVAKSKLAAAPEMALNLSAPILTAKAALAYDYDSGTILYSKNLDEKLPVASLTKLMTALVVYKNTDLNSKATIKKFETPIVGNTMGLVAGEVLIVNDLLKGMLISSSNDAALVLGDFVGGTQSKFVELMNQQGRELNLNSSHFSNSVGWDSDENYSNTLDLVKIVREFLKYPSLAEIVKTKEALVVSADGKYSHKLRTTNKLLLDDPNVVGLKTGFTSQAKGNLIIFYDHYGSKILTIVLGSDGREDDTQKLLDWLLKVYRW